MTLIKIRSRLVPVVNFCSKIGYLAIGIGLFGQLTELFYVGIALLSTILLFQLVTLPVEFDASTRGMINIEKMSLLTASEKEGASKVLVAAALTYVASLITTVLEIVRLILSATRDR
jgi:Zn-dependent membrane protease YugP